MLNIIFPCKGIKRRSLEIDHRKKLEVTVASDIPNVNMGSQTSKEQCLENSKGKAYAQPNYQLSLRVEYSHLHKKFLHLMHHFSEGTPPKRVSYSSRKKYIGLGNRGPQLKTEGFPVKGSPGLMSGQSPGSSWLAGSRKMGLQGRPSQEQYLTGRKPDVCGK